MEERFILVFILLPTEHFRSYCWTYSIVIWKKKKRKKKSGSPIPKFKDKHFATECCLAPTDPLTISSYTLCSIEIFAYLYTYIQ